MITSIHHIAIIVSCERSLDFYKVLGFTEKFRKKREFDTVVLMNGYGIEIEFFIDQRHPVRGVGVDEPIGLRHFALQTSDKLENEIEKLQNSSLCILKVGPIMIDWTGVRFCFLYDLDGTIVELREITVT